MIEGEATGPASANLRTQAVRRAETERRLLEAALDLIAQSGSRSISTAAVGAAAGYSRGIVTHQFGSKKELLRRAVEYSQALVDVSPQASGVEWLLELVDRYLSTAAEGRNATSAFLLMWSEAVANDDNVREVYIERDSWFRSQIADAVKEGASQGVVRDGVDADAFAYLLVAVLRGSILQLLLSPDATMIRRLKAECATLIQRHLS